MGLVFQSRSSLTSQFLEASSVPCFWCGTGVTRTKVTVDHLVPTYLLKLIEEDVAEQIKEEGNMVAACAKCNGLRSKISTLASNLKFDKKWMRSKVDKWLNLRNEIIPILKLFKRRIELSVEGQSKIYCLQEIKFVRSATAKSFEDRICEKYD